MRQYCRKIVGLLGPGSPPHGVKRGHFALLSCGHMGNYAQPRDIGRFQFCPVCAQPKDIWRRLVPLNPRTTNRKDTCK